MTLITYLNRVHFADGVLEEALRSEIERNRHHRPLIIAECGDLSGNLADRLFASFPIRTSTETFADVPSLPTEAAALQIARTYRETGRDHLVAFGSNRAIDLAKVARIAIAYDEPLAALSSAEGGTQRIGNGLPDLFAVPGISGFASSVSDYARVKVSGAHQVLMSSRHLIPTVTICDPTLTLSSTVAASASAASGAVSRGIDSFLSRGYNPPADGLALDGLSRTVRFLRRAMEDDELEARREMMAGSLNSALSLQKGVCVVHAITNALASVSRVQIDPSAAGRLLMPGLLRFYGDRIDQKSEALRNVFNLRDDVDLADGIAGFLADLPLPNRLADMGLDGEDIDAAASIAARDRAIGRSPRAIGMADIRSIIEAAH
ncbi:iron-containing alcohol dehydrogenase [Thalassobaculum sp.]|uniref:iron-containing alcohol dehydrogenase n=1 Tax=Thalassobaculum sp. TaxID=2022740 RepID=UPI0032EAB1C4